MVENSEKTERFHIEKGLRTQEFRAKELGLSWITLLRERQRGRLGFVRVGNRVFYSEQHIEQWLGLGERRGKAA